MASYWIEYSEQVNPDLLEEVKTQKGAFRDASRAQESFLARLEKGTLVWLAERTPSSINADHLTLVGLGAQLAAAAGYVLSRWNRYALFGVVAALALNWLGDSLDGTLARFRNQQRPRYGFYVDHMVDSLGALALMGGLALSGYIDPWIAISLLVAFLLLSIQSYLATYTLGEFRLSFWKFGPTEIRILLAVGNITLFFHPRVLQGRYRLFDVGGVVAIVGMSLMLTAWTAKNTCRLYREETLR